MIGFRSYLSRDAQSRFRVYTIKYMFFSYMDLRYSIYFNINWSVG